MAAAVVLVPLSLIAWHTWYFAMLFGYLLLVTTVRAAMARGFGPEWERVPDDVSVIRHLRRLRHERRAEARDAGARRR